MRKELAAGANPNFQGRDGVVPLFWAIKCENKAGVEALLAGGADPNLKVAGKFSPTFAAASYGGPAILKLLLRYGGDPNTYYGGDPGQSALKEAFSAGDNGHGWGSYELLLANGADVNVADAGGGTIATYAVSMAEYERAEELLDRGYTRDLEGLGRYVQLGEGDGDLPGAARARAHLKAKLAALGVRFPVGPRAPAR